MTASERRRGGGEERRGEEERNKWMREHVLVGEQRNKAKRGEKAEALDQRRGVHSSVSTPPALPKKFCNPRFILFASYPGIK